MLKRAILAVTVVSATMLGILLHTTTPASTGPLGILAFFVFMYLSALGVLTFLFRGASVLVAKTAPLKLRQLKTRELSLRKSYYYASVIALAPVMMVAIQSVGEIGPYQILLVVFFLITAWIYVANRTA